MECARLVASTNLAAVVQLDSAVGRELFSSFVGMQCLTSWASWMYIFFTASFGCLFYMRTWSWGEKVEHSEVAVSLMEYII